MSSCFVLSHLSFSSIKPLHDVFLKKIESDPLTSLILSFSDNRMFSLAFENFKAGDDPVQLCPK
jgi:hypothetical protein